MNENHYKKIIIQKTTNKKEKLSVYLSKNGFGRAYLKSLSSVKGAILKNGDITTLACIVEDGDCFSLACSPKASQTNIQLSSEPLCVIFEDTNILVIDKPSGIATMPTKQYYADNMVARVANYYAQTGIHEKVRIITRLDRDVAGVMLIAKTSLASNFFAKNKNFLKKHYQALLDGKLENEIVCTQKIQTLYDENEKICGRITSENGKSCNTIFTPVNYNDENNSTKCDIEILTGRTHQIRIHSKFIGHSVLGDFLYGERKNGNLMLICKSLQIKKNTFFDEQIFFSKHEI